MEGTVLGDRYELIDKIGAGGMSVVYRARCKILDRIVAVKILKEEYSKDKTFVEKFKTEALSAARISHPNIVNIYDVGQQGDIYYIIMEYVDGKTLKQVICEEAPLSTDKALNIAIMICDGVHHAHEKGIIHRDIKPHNILITTNGIVKVADFGIARAMTNATITYGNNIVGSVHYISPEQAKGEVINRTTDIYSIGCVLYEMLTGKVPFNAESPITVALKHIHDQPPSPRLINNEIPIELEKIIFKAMEKQPAQRFSTAENMRNALLNQNSDLLSDYPPKRRNRDKYSDAFGAEERSAGMKKKKIRPLGVAIIIMALLALSLGIVYGMGGSIFGKEVAVPDVTNLTIKEAQEVLKTSGLVLNRDSEQNSDEVEKDLIISQDPVKGRKVKEGRVVNVTVSLGSSLVEVPNLVGKSKGDAELSLHNKGLVLSSDVEERYDEQREKGQVISQKPSANDKAKAGSEVYIAISKGKQPNRISMPTLKGQSIENARKILENNKLQLSDDIKKQSSNLYYPNQISVQDPEAGVLVEEGSTVKVTVSTGPGPVAKTTILPFTLPSEQAFYKVVVKVTDPRGERNVYSQLHRGGDKVNIGVMHYGSGTAEVTLNGKQFQTFPL